MDASLANGRYELKRPLGEGGMATVHAAWDTMLHVDRAVKVLSPRLNKSGTLRERFLTEARTMARLSHPNIVQVVDVGIDAERVYMVMELMPAGSLQDWMERDGPLAPHDAGRVARAVLEALVVAHAEGIVHRDIKPQNILLADDGTPKLADFGIAHVDTRQLTRTGSVMGTLGFMAPEQRISARRVDARADLYAVGTTLFAALTGQMPIDLYASELDEELLVGIPAPLVPVIQRSTRYKPDQRFDDAVQMRQALDLALSQIPVDAPAAAPVAVQGSNTMSLDDLEDGTRFEGAQPDGTMDPGSLVQEPAREPIQPPSRAPLVVGLLLLLGVGIGGGVGAWWWATQRAEPEPEPEPTVVEEPVVEAPEPVAAPVTPKAAPVAEDPWEEPVPVAAPSADVGGTWRGSFNSRSLTLVLNPSGTSVTGSATLYVAGMSVKTPITGTVEVDENGDGTILVSGQRRLGGNIVLDGTVSGGDSMSGIVRVGANEKGTWSASR